MDYGMIFGGGLSFDLCFGKMILDVRYSLGLTNIATNIPELAELYVFEGLFFQHTDLRERFLENNSLKNKALLILVGFGF
jgi:hypothetical protein